jgi:4-hydroxy-tetrahydrodipicolinate reductase
MISNSVSITHIGLGPLGIALLQAIAQRPVFRLEHAVDVNPALVGQDVGELTGCSALSGIRVQNELPPAPQPGQSVAILTTVSTLRAVAPQIEKCLNAGYHVVTSCEELSHPWQRDEKISAAIDALAKERGLAVLGTGVNPGFVMDFLPLSLTGICHQVDHILVERFQDAFIRRVPFQKKIGVGLSPTEFQQRIDDGSLRHVGLEESMRMIAAQLGWKLDRVEDNIEPIIAQHRITSGYTTVEAGQAAGVKQTGRGFAGETEVLTLLFQAAVGLEAPHDRIVVSGQPGFESKIAGGINGDLATCSVLLNASRAIRDAKPGLRTMNEVPGISWFASK